MSVIKVMDSILANKIAAGEVVERCASVVKELVENSIDAGSTDIKVELKESGIKEIKVTDNGKGMDKEDAVNCFSRHATSKLINEMDLFHIHTLGFRGEALASIASVSRVTLTTSQGDIGTIVKINGGKVESVSKGDARKGTIMCVQDLFYNTPARLKYLKSLYTELAHITDYMNKLSLSHSDIRFTLINDGKVLLKTDGSGNLLKTIKCIYGVNATKKMLEINGSNDDYEVSGYISLPEIHRSNKNGMITIVNGRVVKNTTVNRCINDAYHSYKPDNYYPIAILNITVDTSLVDVNIHPTKMDIKFSKLDELTDLISKLIKEKITKKTLIPHIEEQPVIKERKVYEEFTLDFDTVDESEEEYVINNELVNNEEENIEVHEDVKEKLPLLYPVGLVHGTYIICQNDNGMYIIDQHAAKERVNYEKYRYKLSHPKHDTVDMLFPLTMELSNNEYLIIRENINILRDMDFKIEEFGVNSIIVKSHPTWLPKGFENETIKHIIDLVIHKEKNFSLERFNDHLAATLACKASIKANTNITNEEMENLISDLRNCENPFNCPHGRPTIIYYSSSDLEKMFKRSGF